MDKIFLKECFLQKTNQYDALEVLSNDKNALNLGSELFLCFDEKFDKDKKIVFAKKKNTEKTIGALSVSTLRSTSCSSCSFVVPLPPQ